MGIYDEDSTNESGEPEAMTSTSSTGAVGEADIRARAAAFPQDVPETYSCLVDDRSKLIGLLDEARQQLASLTDQLQAAQCAEKMTADDNRALKQQLAEMRGHIQHVRDLAASDHDGGLTEEIEQVANAALASSGREEAGEKMFAFDIELRGEKARVEGWFSGSGPDDPCEFDIGAIWLGWSEANRAMPEHAGGPNPLDLSTLTDDEDEAITDAAFSAVANLLPTPPAQTQGKCE